MEPAFFTQKTSALLQKKNGVIWNRKMHHVKSITKCLFWEVWVHYLYFSSNTSLYCGSLLSYYRTISSRNGTSFIKSFQMNNIPDYDSYTHSLQSAYTLTIIVMVAENTSQLQEICFLHYHMISRFSKKCNIYFVNKRGAPNFFEKKMVS